MYTLQMATTRPTMDQQARDLAPDAISTLHSIMAYGDKDSDRIAAAKELLDRGHGRPVSAVVQIPMTRRTAEALSAMSEDQLFNVVKSAQLPRLRSAQQDEPITIEATATNPTAPAGTPPPRTLDNSSVPLRGSKRARLAEAAAALDPLLD